MRINIPKLIAAGSLDRRALKYAGVVLLCAAVCAGMLIDLNRRSARIKTLAADLQAKEQQTSGTRIPTEDEVRRTAEEERLFNGILVGDESVPLVFDEITRAGSDHRVQMEIQSEEKALPETPEDSIGASARALGITRYLVVTVTFRAEYSDAAQFVSSISRLPHSIALRSLEMHRDPPSLSGTLRLHVYKRGGA